MSRKHGGLSRKDALKGRKGARNKQDLVARGDDDMSTTLVIPKDGDIDNAKFVSKDFIRKVKRRGIDPFGPEFDKYRLEVVYDEQTGEYKTQPYEINAKQPLCPPSPPETPATRTSRERRLPDMEDSGRQDNDGADMIPDQDYTILSSKHFSLRSPIKRSDPQSYSPLVESFTSVAQGSSFAAASCASFPSSPEPPVAGPSRPSGLPASAASLQREGVRQAAKINKQHKAAFSSRNAYSPAPKNVTPAVSRTSVASATHDFSNFAHSSPAGSAREKQLFGLYLSALEANVGIDFKGEWNGKAKSREHLKKKRDGVLADGKRGVARDGKLGEIIVPEPDTRPFANDTRPDRTQKGPILVVGSAHNGIETDDDLRMAKERDADAYSVQWVKQVTEDWEADKSVRIDVFGPQYDKYRLEIIYDEEGKCWSTQPYFKNAESLMPLPTTTVSLSSITSAFGSEPQQNNAVEEDVHRMEYVMVNGNNASLAAEHSAPAEPFESPPHPVISTISVANESSFETTAEEAPTIDELVQQFFEALIQVVKEQF